jgi:hypothetical protein
MNLVNLLNFSNGNNPAWNKGVIIGQKPLGKGLVYIDHASGPTRPSDTNHRHQRPSCP